MKCINNVQLPGIMPNHDVQPPNDRNGDIPMHIADQELFEQQAARQVDDEEKYAVDVDCLHEEDRDADAEYEDEDEDEEIVLPANASPEKDEFRYQPRPKLTGVNGERKIRFEERPYQVEIVEKAMDENTIVCLGTGTGKTFISATLIKEMQGGIKGKYESKPVPGKRTFFLVTTVPLVYQQAAVIEEATCLKVGMYTGDMEVDFWDEKKWHHEFNEHDVLVMTCQILVNILNHAFIALRHINLLILDECHNATKKHPYAQLLEIYKKYPDDQRPHILGLTASIINEKYKKQNSGAEDIKDFLKLKMRDLEIRMGSKCVTCSDPTSTEKYATKPIEVIKTYKELSLVSNGFDDVHAMGNPEGELIQRLREASRRFKALQKEREEAEKELLMNGLGVTEEHEGEEEELPHLENLQLKEQVNPAELCEQPDLNKETTSTNVEYILGRNGLRGEETCLTAADAVKYCADIICQLGPHCGYDAADVLIKQLGKHKDLKYQDLDKKVLEECQDLLKDVKTTYEESVANTKFAKPRNVEPMEPFITKKVCTFLRDVLLQEKKYFKEEYDTDMHAIVFVERRCTAVILNKLINFQVRADRESFDGIKSRYVLGHGLDANVNLSDSQMRANDQNKVIKEFKSGEFNVLVATSVVEEGLDVRKCNLVVRFDGITNYRQYAQSKGRARMANSKFITMTPVAKEAEAKTQMKIMQEIETVLSEMCLEKRTLPSKEEMAEAVKDEEDDTLQPYFATDEPDAARVSRYTSVALLHRYCSMLPSDQYSNTTPRFTYITEGIGQDRRYKATVYLPMNFPLEQKVHENVNWFDDVETCKQALSLTICICLHTANELDNNLLPVRHTKEESDDEEERDELKPKEGTRKSQDYYHRKFPNVLQLCSEFKLEECELFVIRVTLNEPRDRPSSLALHPFWNDNNRKGFGILYPPGIPKVLPPVQLFTRAGGLHIHFVHVTNDNSILKKDEITRFHCSMMAISAVKHVSGKFVFDIDDLRVSKGLLVPVTGNVLDAVYGDSVSEFEKLEENAVDVDGIKNFLYNGVDIGRSCDTGLKNAIINKTYLDFQQNRRLYYIAGYSDQRGGDFMEGEVTYAQYYLNKYSYYIPNDAFLLEAVPCPSRVNFSEDMAKQDCKKQSTYKPERLIPDLCRKAFPTHAHLHQQLNVLPYTLYLFDCILNAYELRETIANTLCISTDDHIDPSSSRDVEMSDNVDHVLEQMLQQSLVINKDIQSPTIMEALETLTTRQAKFPYDLERLEMLGDSFLKQAITVYLFFRFPKAHEGILSSKRKRCISNKNLCRIAKFDHVGLQHIICNSQFGNVNPNNENKNSMTVWLPPGCYRGDEELVTDDSLESVERKGFVEMLEGSIVFRNMEDECTAEEKESSDKCNGSLERDGGNTDTQTNSILQLLQKSEIFKNMTRSCDEMEENMSSSCNVTEKSGTTKTLERDGGRNVENYEREERVGMNNVLNTVNRDITMDKKNIELINCNVPPIPHSTANELQGKVIANHIEISDESMTDNEANSIDTEDTEDDTTEQHDAEVSKVDEIHISKDLPYQLVQDKSLADCIEALIGLYFKVGGTNLALEFMQKYLCMDVMYRAIPEKGNCTVQENTQSEYADYPKQLPAIQNPKRTDADVMSLYERMKLNRLEKMLGYTFQDKSFIVQAMTHLSYTTNDVTGCYQQLEFLGDAILDFLVTLHIYVNKPNLSPGELTSLRSALVNNNTFGLLVIKLNWHKFLQHLSPKLYKVINEFVNVADGKPGSLDVCFENPFVIVPDNTEEGYHAPKVLGDIFESVAGAIFVDSHLNLVKTWEIIYPIMKPIIDKYMEKIPLNPIREFYEKYTAGILSYDQVDEDMVECKASYGNGKTKVGMGKNRRIAKSTVCHKAVYGN